jgi:glycerol-1-phosphate dehydrogenase [NAD(P)+]
MGERVARALRARGPVTEIILDAPHADMATVRDLTARLKDFPSAVAVGSGTINDLTKYATLQNGRSYCVFGTAGSMNGYTSSTASITLDSGLKVSLPAQTPAGFFVDLEVCAAAPAYLNAAGFGDCLCRSVAQIDWWMSHRLLGTMYRHEPYVIEIPDEIRLMAHAKGVAEGDVEAIGTLFRVLTLCGLGINFTGVSNHGSMGEHQISHYLDCFAGARHPGSLHGQQVGVATLTMARIQSRFLSSESPPEIGPTVIDKGGMIDRMGAEVAAQCLPLVRRKAFDAAGADAINARLAKIWPELRAECLEMAVPVATLEQHLVAAGGPTTATALGFPAAFYREAVTHAHEMRDRFSFADIAAGSGMMAQLASGES